MLDVRLPDLTFPNLTYGETEVPWDLRRWLYRGGARANVRVLAAMIDSGRLGRPLVERIELVSQIHEVMANYLERGARRATVHTQIEKLNQFVQWADQAEESGHGLSLASVEQSYRHWTDHLLHRVRVGKGMKEMTAYSYGSIVGWVLDQVLGRSKSIVKTTRLRTPKRSPRAVSPKADKQSLAETFALGHFLLDLADGLDEEAIWGPLPVRIPLRSGKTLEEWSWLQPMETLERPNPKYRRQTNYNAKLSAKNRTKWEAEKTFRTRYPLINLRIQVEMFMLMGQPAVNLAQVHQLRMDQWRYKPSIHGYELRTYKNRRWGPVVFEIYSRYRAVFDRYLKWRAAIFPNDPDGLLFPLLGRLGTQSSRHPETAPHFDRVKSACKRAGVKYLPPGSLRNTSVNWMLRRTQDPDMTAAEKQHSTKTLLGAYEKPSLQRAMVQVQVFWAKHDPAQAAAGPGSCAGETPEPIADLPAAATRPDCKTPAGCLFCAHQRDIDSLDHLWSLASYRLLKSFELRAQARAESEKELSLHPAELVIERLTAKLHFIESSSRKRSSWVKEALLRIEEGRYHPAWAGMIESI